jgi:hypothetical protein
VGGTTVVEIEKMVIVGDVGASLSHRVVD